MAEEVDYEEEEMNVQVKKDVEEASKLVVEKPVVEKEKSTKIKMKGRGHQRHNEDDDRYNGRGGVFERLEQSAIEGWIIFISNVHLEATEDHILDKCSEYGDVKNIHLNLDRRTGYVKGYALVEYESYDDALTAIKALNGKPLLEQTIEVGWAFTKK